MKIALAQINSLTRDIEGNVNKIVEFIKQAKEKGADIIVFPEVATTGYCMADNFNRLYFIKQNKKLLEEKIVPATKGIIAIVGFVDFDCTQKMRNGKIAKWNAAVVIKDGIILQVRHKSLLPNYDVFDDWRYFKAGTEENVKPIEVTIDGRRVNLGVIICEELWEDDYDFLKPVKLISNRGADLLISLSASPSYTDRVQKRIEVCQKRIQENKIPLVYVNTVGVGDIGKNIIPFDGMSMAFNNKGELLAHAKQFEEELLIVDYDLAEPIDLPKINKWQKIHDQLVMSVRDYFNKTGFKKAIIGLSGGIDSAIVACIAVTALGKENVITVNMPSRFNSNITKDAAKDLAENLGVKYVVWPIEDITNIHRKTYKDLFGEDLKGVSDQNLQARFRGNILMTVSNAQNCLVLSTGNKTEVALGYCTLYGDMVGGLCVPGDLNKLEVYKVAEYINQKAGKAIIPEATIKVKASAELGEEHNVEKGQGDPFDYSVVAPIVDELVNNDEEWIPELIKKFEKKQLDENLWAPDNEGKTVYEKFTKEEFVKLVEDIAKKLDRSAYKRMQAAPIIRVSINAFGWDYREVIVKK